MVQLHVYAVVIIVCQINLLKPLSVQCLIFVTVGIDSKETSIFIAPSIASSETLVNRNIHSFLFVSNDGKNWHLTPMNINCKQN